MIRIVRVTNPVDPSRGKQILEVSAETGASLKVLLSFAFLMQLPEGYDGELEDWYDWAIQHHVSVNGQVWPPSMWPEITPKDGYCIVIVPVVQGGGLLRTLASVAVIAAAAAVSGGFGGVLGSALFNATSLTGFGALSAVTSLTTALLASAVSIGGNLLVSELFSGHNPSSKSVSASYDPDGPKSLARSGVVIPKGCGTFRWGGNQISSFTEIAGLDVYINALFCYGFGPARSITDIEINGKPIGDYQNVQYYVRLGTNDQTELANFNRISNGYPQETQCVAGVAVVVPGTGTRTQIGEVDIQFPAGVFFNTSNGNIIEAVVTYQVQYRENGTTGDWLSVLRPKDTSSVIEYHLDGSPYLPYAWGALATDLGAASNVVYHMDNGPHTPGDPYTGTATVTTYQPNGNHNDYSKTCRGEWQLLDANLNYVAVDTWTDGYVDFVGASTSPLYNRTTIFYPYAAKWDIQVTKYGSARIHDDVQPGDNESPQIGQDVWLHEVNEITLQDLVYPNMILIGVRALATSQLSGQGLTVTALIEHGLHSVDDGLMMPALASYEEDNPACVAADMFLSDMYGGGAWPGITQANLGRYADEWVGWAENNDALVPDGNGNSIRMCVFNGVFDSEDNLWNAVNKVAQMSRAAIVPVGTDYGVAVAKLEDAPVQMFSVGNILQDSYSEPWLPLDDRSNQVEIQFADSTRYYRQDNPLVYMDPELQNAGQIIKNTRINGFGITLPAQAWHHARYIERQQQFLLQTQVFRTDTDGIASRIFNVIALQHDVPGNGWGGRLLPGSTASKLILDRDDAVMLPGSSYSVMVQHSAVQRFSGTVSAVAASTTPAGTTLTLTGWANTSRVTRAKLYLPGAAAGTDCAVASSDVNSVIVQSPTPGFVPAVGMICVLWDTDVLDTQPVASIDAEGRLVLSTPLIQAPGDDAGYIFGVTGGVKLARVTKVTRSSENRSSLESIDYDARVYDVGTPVIGETTAAVISNQAVTSLIGYETFQKVGGSYISFANLGWKNGPDTVGVGIYAKSVNAPGIAQQVARLTGLATTWKAQIAIGAEIQYSVVGFDSKGLYASFTAAPSVTIEAEGIAQNLLMGSSFASGFTYWNITPRAGDTFLPSFADDGEATYTVVGTGITAAQPLCYQVVDPSEWAVGEYLLLSGYWQDSAVSLSYPNTGDVIFEIRCTNASGTTLSSTTCAGVLGTAVLTRAHTNAVQIPTGTAQVAVYVSIGPASPAPSLHVGSTVTVSHLLLEIADSTQTVPSAWADVDVSGQVLDLFQIGSSSGLRVQASATPVTSGTIGYHADDASVTPYWTGLTIYWTDGGETDIQDASAAAVTGLAPSTMYWAFPYFDVLLGGVHFFTDGADVGGVLFSAYNYAAAAACYLDNRVALAQGGLKMTTAASGGTGGEPPVRDPQPIYPVLEGGG